MSALYPALAQLFAVCALSTAVKNVSDGESPGIRAICGLSVALTILRLALEILK